MLEIIEKGENESIDFKDRYHECKINLIHDILCLANADSEHNQYNLWYQKLRLQIDWSSEQFGNKSISAYVIAAWHPDDFVSYLIDIAPGAICIAIPKLRSTLKTQKLNKSFTWIY